MTVNDMLMSQLKELHLPAFREQFESMARRAEQESWSFEKYLSALAQFECDARRINRVERFLKMSRLPIEKSMDNFDLKKLPTKLRRVIPTLAQGTFLDRCENILAFGRPGSGKTHALCAVAQELIRAGRKVYFSPCSLLVQDLLIAKRDLKLSRVLKRLASFEAILIDDIGYVQQSREEMEVLFTLLADRYERSSIMDHQQPRFWTMGGHLQRPHDNRRRNRSTRSPQRDPRVQRKEPPTGRSSVATATRRE